jgi:hypothetical protein
LLDWKQLSISTCQTHHIQDGGHPAYNKRFTKVAAFHTPGLAPVSLETNAWHIFPNGLEAYEHKFQKTFGFYCDLAAVCKDDTWFHIYPNGKSAYSERFQWTGNFQDNLCAVCGLDGLYFHIDREGQSITDEKWAYCGDFREGYAVVQSESGLSSHIDHSGELLHNQWLDDLDVFHKGFARAKQDDGWFHINHSGKALYPQRFSQIEPFYNGCARVEKHNGERLIINESGSVLRNLRRSTQSEFHKLSRSLVGFWGTCAIGTAVELGIFDNLPNSVSRLSAELGLDPDLAGRLVSGLAELSLVNRRGEIWESTSQGDYLKSDHQCSLASAALEYRNHHLKDWLLLLDIIKGKPLEKQVFVETLKSEARRTSFHQMLQSYAAIDYPAILPNLPIEPGSVIFDAGGGTGTLARLIKEHFPDTDVIFGDLPELIENIADVPGVKKHSFNLFEKWGVDANQVVLSRVLHDWEDNDARVILLNAYSSLLPGGQIFILEMVREEEQISGALCDLHLLAVCGGKERTFRQYQELLDQTGFKNAKFIKTNNLVKIISASKS